MRYFDQDLVGYRGESGEVHILDAHCRHMGAHLGYGGKVCGDELQCPFHGWRWSSGGKNVDIPYSNGSCSRRTLKAWSSVESSGVVMVWHSPAENVKPWTLPKPLVPQFDDPTYHRPFPESVGCREVAAHPQWITENVVDPTHIAYVHGQTHHQEVTSWAADGPWFSNVTEGKIDSPRGPVVVRSDSKSFGVGLMMNVVEGLHSFVNLQGVTPIDQRKSIIHFTVYVQSTDRGPVTGSPTGIARALVKAELREVLGDHADVRIWEHLEYLDRPGFTKEEQAMGAFRRWSRQFYDD